MPPCLATDGHLWVCDPVTLDESQWNQESHVVTCFDFLSLDEWLGKEARSPFLPWKSEGRGKPTHPDYSSYFRFTMASVDHDPDTHLPVHWHSESFGLEGVQRMGYC